MNKRKFGVQNLVFAEEDAKSQFATVQIDAFSSGENRHNLTCPVELLKSTAHTLYEKPIVFEINSLFQDFGSHVDSEDERKIAGFIVPNSAEFFDRDDGRVGLRVQGKIWKYYAQFALGVFKSAEDMVKKVSVEMLMADPDGDVMTDFEYTGISLLGDMLTEASPDAQAKLLSFSSDDYDKAYKAEFAKYAEIDFTIPQEVKNNCQDGMDIYEEFGRGGTSVSLAMARHVIKNERISIKKIRKMSKFFGANGGRIIPKDIEGKEFISWQLYGGTSGREWSSKIVDEMNVSDESLVAYFDGDNSPDSKNALGDNSEGKEKNMKKDEKEVFEEEVKPEDDEVSMAEEDAPETEEEMAAEEDTKEEEMAEEESDDEESEEDDEDVDMGCDEKKYENLFTELETKFATLEAETVILREFKSNIEQKQFKIKVESVLGSVKHLFDTDGLGELREDAVKNYSLETLNGWENLVKAKGFERSEKLPKIEEVKDDGVLKMALVEDGVASSVVYPESPWG